MILIGPQPDRPAAERWMDKILEVLRASENPMATPDVALAVGMSRQHCLKVMNDSRRVKRVGFRPRDFGRHASLWVAR